MLIFLPILLEISLPLVYSGSSFRSFITSFSSLVALPSVCLQLLFVTSNASTSCEDFEKLSNLLVLAEELDLRGFLEDFLWCSYLSLSSDGSTTIG